MHDCNGQTTCVVVDDLIRGHCGFSKSANQRLLLQGIASYDRWIETTGEVFSRVLVVCSGKDARRVVADQRQRVECKSVRRSCCPWAFQVISRWTLSMYTPISPVLKLLYSNSAIELYEALVVSSVGEG